MTNYIIESDNNIIINKEINKILKDNNLSKDNLITYNLEEKNIGDVVMDLDTVSLFGDIKVIYGYNANFLGTEKSSIEHDIDYFSKYIKNPSNNILILSVSTLDSRKKIVKKVKSCFNVISPILDPIEFIKNKLRAGCTKTELAKELNVDRTTLINKMVGREFHEDFASGFRDRP